MRHLVLPLLVGVVLLAAVGEPATVAGAKGSKAAVGRILDPRDSLGPLDIAAASAHLRTEAAQPKVVLRLRTYNEWGTADLVTRGIAPNGLTFEFSRRGSRQSCLDIRLTPDGGLMGQMMRYCYPIRFGRLGAPVRVRRTSLRRAEAVVPLRQLGGGTAPVRWRAISSYEAAGHPGCAPPVYPPPEHPYGTCADFTREGRLKRPSAARRSRR